MNGRHRGGLEKEIYKNLGKAKPRQAVGGLRGETVGNLGIGHLGRCATLLCAADCPRRQVWATKLSMVGRGITDAGGCAMVFAFQFP